MLSEKRACESESMTGWAPAKSQACVAQGGKVQYSQSWGILSCQQRRQQQHQGKANVAALFYAPNESSAGAYVASKASAALYACLAATLLPAAAATFPTA
jgi:hypothetical protein